MAQLWLFLFSEHTSSYPRFDMVSLFRDRLGVTKVTADSHTFHRWRYTFRNRMSEAGYRTTWPSGWGDGPRTRPDHAERTEELRAAVEKAKQGRSVPPISLRLLFHDRFATLQITRIFFRHLGFRLLKLLKMNDSILMP